jgi:hypothetical protein
LLSQCPRIVGKPPTFGPHQAASATVRIYPPPSVAMLDIVDKRFDFVDIS